MDTPLNEHRKRQKRRGIVRVEIQVGKDDAPLIRKIASVLSDPERAPAARVLLRQRFGDGKEKGLKALLAAAPLDGIDLERSKDSGRAVEL